MPPLKKFVLPLILGMIVAQRRHPQWRWFVLQVTQLKSALKPVVSLCGLCSRYVFKMKEY